MNTLRFTSMDLEANRQGYLTDAQHKKLDADIDFLRRQRRYVALGFVALCVWNLVTNEGIAYDRSGRDVSQLFVGENLTTLLNSVALLIALPCLVLLCYRLLIRGLARRTVRSVEGKAHLIKRNPSRIPSFHKVQIWHGLLWMTFYFDDAESMAYFQSGQRYRVYYIPLYLWRRALSCEEILDEKAKRSVFPS